MTLTAVLSSAREGGYVALNPETGTTTQGESMAEALANLVARVESGNTVCGFDIGGNKFRLIAKVSYEKGKVYVLRVLTHKEYDTGKWKAEL